MGVGQMSKRYITFFIIFDVCVVVPLIVYFFIMDNGHAKDPITTTSAKSKLTTEIVAANYDKEKDAKEKWDAKYRSRILLKEKLDDPFGNPNGTAVFHRSRRK